MTKPPQNPRNLFVRAVAWILAILFIMSSLAALLLFNLELHAFNPATYKKALLGENFYQNFPILLSSLLTKNLGPHAPLFIQRLSADQWRPLVESLLSAEQLQSMTEESLNQMLAYLNGETVSPRISLLLLKHNLAGPAGLNFVMGIIRAQPACTLQEIAKILATIGSGELCDPPAALLNLLQPIIQSQVASAAAAIPNELPLLADPNSPSNLANLAHLRTGRLVMRLSPLLPILLLFALTILIIRSFRNWLMWWGWPLLLTGTGGMLIGFAAAPYLGSFLPGYVLNNLLPSAPPEIVSSIGNVLAAALTEMLRPAGWQSLILFVSGGLMIVIERFLAGRARRSKIARSEERTQLF